MARRIDKFGERFNSEELKSEFKRVTGISADENPSAYIAFIASLSAEVNFKALEELHNQIKELKQTFDKK